MLYSKYLKENIANISITIEDMEKLLNKRWRLNDEERRNVDFLLDWYYQNDNNKKDVEYILNRMSEDLNKAIQYLGEVPYCDNDHLKRELFDREEPWNGANTTFFPITVYVSADPKDKNTIGLLIYEDGRKEMFEGNDEASDETYELVDNILYPNEEIPVKIYGSHSEDAVNKISETSTLPPNLFISPDRSYAEGYFGKDRILFSGIINKKDIRQESEYDWKTKRNTKISKLRIF